MSHRRTRGNQLWAASVIIAALIITSLYLFIMIAGYEQAKADTPTARQTLPQKCEYLRVEPDPAYWDEVLETYPPNLAWEECMGVERK